MGIIQKCGERREIWTGAVPVPDGVTQPRRAQLNHQLCKYPIIVFSLLIFLSFYSLPHPHILLFFFNPRVKGTNPQINISIVPIPATRSASLKAIRCRLSKTRGLTTPQTARLAPAPFFFSSAPSYIQSNPFPFSLSRSLPLPTFFPHFRPSVLVEGSDRHHSLHAKHRPKPFVAPIPTNRLPLKEEKS